MKVTERIEAFNKKMEDYIITIPNESVDVVCVDPPYKYLKKQKLESDWDEELFFDNVKRILTKKGFIVMFGRGTSFYRWNTMLAERGFIFKEEIVWNKSYVSSPVSPISRVHETVSIYAKNNGTVNASFIPYIEMKSDIKSIAQDINRIKSALNNTIELDEIERFLVNGEIDYKPENKTRGNNTTVQSALQQTGRGVKTLQSIKRGFKEKSIIKIKRGFSHKIHPTAKPIRLIERLLKLVYSEDAVVCDFFSGSFSTAIACHNLRLNFLGCEVDEQYFNDGVQELINHTRQTTLF